MEQSFVSLLYEVIGMLHLWLKFVNFYFILKQPHFSFMYSIMYIINVLIYDMKLQLDEKVVRMKVTMILLLGTHNHYKEDLIRNAERTWHDCIHDKH